MSIRPEPAPARPRQAGISLPEVLVGMLLSLIVLIAAFDFMDSSRKSYQKEVDQADSQAIGRAVLDLLGRDLRAAGYNPMGVSFDAITQSTNTSFRVLSDRDGDGTVGAAGEPNEAVSWRFVGAGGGGLFNLQRGVDVNDDGDFNDTGERIDVVASRLMAIDVDGDGTTEPFFAYDAPAPDTVRVRVTFGVRSSHRDMIHKRFDVVDFQQEIVLRNQVDW